MSQQSNLYSASPYGEDISFPSSDFDFGLTTPITPEISVSQASIVSGSHLSIQPTQPLEPPPHLQRVGPKRVKSWILYTEMDRQDFVKWWLMTRYGSELNGGPRKRIKWDGVACHSEGWKHFDQVADITTGLPKIMCRRCATLLDHPQHKPNGTTSMNRHRRSEYCKKRALQEQSQSNIPDILQKSVSLVNYARSCTNRFLLIRHSKTRLSL
jgi:hypothetical protein